VVKRVILTPADLEAHDPNLVGGDSVAGSHHLRQNFVFRPLPGYSRYRTPIDGLFMTGAATWPGGGVTGLSGRLAAHEVLAAPHLSRRVIGLGKEIGRRLGLRD
jgi:phytoene dehydrogenase-like protein